jgi:TonB family protein
MSSASRDNYRLTAAVALSVAVHLAMMFVLPLRDTVAVERPAAPAPEPETVVARAVEVVPPPAVAPPVPDRRERPRPAVPPRDELATPLPPEPLPLPVPAPLPEQPPVPEPEPLPQPEEPPPAALPPPERERAPSVDQFEWNDALDPLAAYLGERNNRAEEQTVAEITSLDSEAATPEQSEASEEENEIIEDGAETESPLERESAEERVAAAAVAPQPAQEPVPPAVPEPNEEPVDEAEEAAPAELVVQPVPSVPSVVELSPEPGGEVAQTPPPNPLDAFGLGGAVERARQAASDEPATRMIREAASSDSASYLEVFGERDGVDGEALARLERERSLAGDHVARWERTRAALENFDVAARTGTETHLSTISDPFAAYIHALHNKIHPLWSGYLSWLEFADGPGGALADPTLMVELEYIIRADGTVDEVNIVRGSGETMFDAQAIDVLWAIGPHDPPPSTMISPTGFVYIHWEFHRDEQMCWTGGASVRMVEASE